MVEVLDGLREANSATKATAARRGRAVREKGDGAHRALPDLRN